MKETYLLHCTNPKWISPHVLCVSKNAFGTGVVICPNYLHIFMKRPIRCLVYGTLLKKKQKVNKEDYSLGMERIRKGHCGHTLVGQLVFISEFMQLTALCSFWPVTMKLGMHVHESKHWTKYKAPRDFRHTERIFTKIEWLMLLSTFTTFLCQSSIKVATLHSLLCHLSVCVCPYVCHTWICWPD